MFWKTRNPILKSFALTGSNRVMFIRPSGALLAINSFPNNFSTAGDPELKAAATFESVPFRSPNAVCNITNSLLGPRLCSVACAKDEILIRVPPK